MTNHSLALKLALPALAAALLASPARAQKSLNAYAQPNLHDLTASLKVLSHNNAELEKIGKGYTDAYTMEHQQFSYKEPGEVRFQGNKGLIHILRITAGERQLFEVSGLAILKNRHVENLREKPGKADTIMDLGIITPSFADRMEEHWLRAENRGGKKLEVFDVWHKADPRLRSTLWIDPVTKTVVERVDHHRSKKKEGFRKRFVYSDVKQINGVALPTQVTLFNGDNKQAAQMRYDSIRINTGLQDKLFKF